jgi:hypothetical protein
MHTPLNGESGKAVSGQAVSVKRAVAPFQPSEASTTSTARLTLTAFPPTA